MLIGVHRRSSAPHRSFAPRFGGSRTMAAVRLPKCAIRPRPAVLAMAPYSPPTGGRAGNLRLDFNENTVGCSPKVIEFLKANLSASDLAVYPEYTAAKEAIARYFHVAPDQFVFVERKSTRLNSSHLVISYAVFCLKTNN